MARNINADLRKQHCGSGLSYLRQLRLITFQAPEYEISATRGIVRWRIEKGLLVARAGHGGDGYLEIDVRLLDCDVPGKARINVEVEVANFYPAIASRLGRFLYKITQSKIHVFVTHGFLRRLAHRELDESVTGRFRAVDGCAVCVVCRSTLPRDSLEPGTKRLLGVALRRDPRHIGVVEQTDSDQRYLPTSVEIHALCDVSVGFV